MEYNELVQGFAERYGVQGVQTVDGVTALEIDTLKISLIHDEMARNVIIYGEIGLPPPDANGAFSGTLLKADHLLHGTGGAILCQNPETGAYVVFRSFPLSALDLTTFCAEIGHLVDQAEDWKKLMDTFRVAEESAAAASAKAATETLSSLADSRFIPV